MPRTLLPLALAAATLAMTATEADAAVVPDIQDRVLTVTGDDAADLITLRIPAASPTSLEIDLGDDGTADFRIPRTRFDAVRVVAGGGDDRVRIDDGGTRFPLTVPTTVLGGAGNDALTGGRGAETLLAGDGADKVAGGGGADVVDLGAGDDRYDWRAADGNDDVDGGSGSDLVLADGTDADDRLTLSAAGARARIAGDTTALGTAGVEHVDVNARSGSDVITIGDLTGTAVQQVEPNLSLGLTDAGADRVVLAGTPGNDVVNVFPNGLGSALVVGTHAVVRVRHADPVRDALTVQGGAGRDDLGGGGDLPLALALDGGDGDDQLSGTAAADTLLGGAGNDFADGQRGDDDVRLGDGNDVYAVDAGDGADAVRGDAGTDRISLSGSSAKEQFEVAAAGQGARIAVGATAIETPGGVERVDLLSFGGSDRVAVRDLTGTGVTDVTASLFDFGVPGGAFDEVTVDGTAGDDVVTAAAGPVVLTGLPAKVTVTGTAAGDRLVIDGKDGKDTIDSTALPAGGIAVHGFGSAGDDVLLGGDGDDVLGGGDGSDVIFAGSGDNVALGGAGDDVLRGEEGDDVLDGGAGDDILIGGAGDDVLLNGEVVFDD